MAPAAGDREQAADKGTLAVEPGCFRPGVLRDESDGIDPHAVDTDGQPGMVVPGRQSRPPPSIASLEIGIL